ncbi:uncharacterized protein BX663DRAFT_551595 [Cokeromyces recurvatus]|uniref:uncharacterized protein n=1 Tax=Cokeromyces recurvatus TaxID=90255 RepID=UPI00221EAEEF|nr:uncharacterized protein BX663DRAFT_551595 [Cokeromyces recurvatus]KAI7903304.1 hypothetical protein BX663DRAFT_551595 [Cokeromyces recurvatus]
MANEIKVLVYMTGIIAAGYGLMKYTVPDEEAMKKRLDPTLRREYDERKAENREKGEQMMNLMREVAASDKPVWEMQKEKRNQ